MSVNTAIQNTVSFYNGTHKFKFEETSLNIQSGYMQYQLYKKHEELDVVETLWAERTTAEGTTYFVFDINTGLTELTVHQWNTMMAKIIWGI